MYYDRKLTDSFAQLIKQNGSFRWLFDYVKNNKELDFLIGKNNHKEWISVYRGLSRILSISFYGKQGKYSIDAADAYKRIAKDNEINIYGEEGLANLSANHLDNLIAHIENEKKFDRYYKNKKEGFYQNILSRRYGICGTPSDDFVIIDKEAVIGYASEKEEAIEYSPFHIRYKNLLGEVSDKDPKRYGSNLSKKPIGNEVDFLALDKNGDLLIIEYKHGTNTSGIYLSPMQIGLYYDLYTDFFNKKTELLRDAIFTMLEQKQKIGLINPAWPKPSEIKNLIPILVISEFNENSAAKDNFLGVMDIARKKLSDQAFLENLRIYNYTSNIELLALNW